MAYKKIFQVKNAVIKSGPNQYSENVSNLTFQIRVSLLSFLERLADVQVFFA